MDGIPLADFLELSSLAMTDPLSGLPLVPGGEDVDVTIDNVCEYVDIVIDRWVSQMEKAVFCLCMAFLS